MLQELLQILTLQSHNTRVVVLGVTALGLAAGIIGSFMLLRKRALVGDALSHATYPGIGAAFMIMAAFGHDAKNLAGLLLGATIAGLLGVGSILAIRKFTRLKEDAALGIVLSTFFGLGVYFDGIIQNMSGPSAAGLSSFITGKTASMISSEAMTIALVGSGVAIVCVLLFKEFKMLCFDQDFASTQGWPVVLLDLLLMGLVTAVTIVGLQAVGLVLVIALLIIPAAAARFWTERLDAMMILAALIGAVSGYIGAALSAVFHNLPAGAVIVLTASALFLVSMFFGRARGVLRRMVDHYQLSRRVGSQHLLRAMFELTEDSNRPTATVEQLLEKRAWSRLMLARFLTVALRDGLVVESAKHQWRLTNEGLAEARRITRNHRLWEIYLMTHADVAANHVDRDADAIEHVLGRPMVEELEAALATQTEPNVPRSPHPM